MIFFNSDSQLGKSYLRSSDWNLLRLEGDIIRDGVECIFTQDRIFCGESDLVSVEQEKTIVVKSTNYYQISLSGFLTKVRIKKSDKKFKTF